MGSKFERSKESFEFKVLKQSNFALQSPLPSWFRKLPINDSILNQAKQLCLYSVNLKLRSNQNMILSKILLLSWFMI